MSGTTQVQKLGVIDFLSMIYNGHPEYSLFAVKAPIDEVVQAWMELREGLSKRDRRDYQTMKYKEYRVKNRQIQWEKNILLKFFKPFRELNEQEQDEYYEQEREKLKPGYPFIQVGNNGWVIVICSLGWLGENELEEVPKAAKELSAKLKTKAITLSEEDTSAAIGYGFFENGELSEKFEQAPGFDLTFESKIRAKPDIKFDYDDEDEDDDTEQEYDISAEPRVKFIDEFFSELGIYLPACWWMSINGKPALEVETTSENTIVCADWVLLQEEWECDKQEERRRCRIILIK
ncbi:hypothetical protein [Nostoc sp.]